MLSKYTYKTKSKNTKNTEQLNVKQKHMSNIHCLKSSLPAGSTLTLTAFHNFIKVVAQTHILKKRAYCFSSMYMTVLRLDWRPIQCCLRLRRLCAEADGGM